MKISETCDLFNANVYFYDIRSCYYKILQNMNYDIEGINEYEKLERNIAIGKEQIDNPELSDFLRTTAESIISYYFKINNIKDSEIIAVQRDGCLLTRMLTENDKVMKLDFRGLIDFMVISPDRKKFLSVSENKVEVKGIANRYDELHDVYDRFMNLNFYNKKTLFKQLHKLKQYVYSGENRKLYIIKKGDKNLVLYNKDTILDIKGSTRYPIKNLNFAKYYDVYFREFIESLFLHFY